jgi:histidyl-tRNA synthetase
MALFTQAPKGTQDFLPEDTYKYQYIERRLLEIAELYGFFEIRTPMFEHTELFVRSVGGTTDVVQKEMYTFLDKKERSITLKPEGTAGAVRAVLEHGLHNKQLPVKLSYVTPCFRYEKPQAGRYRQFHQFGIEMLGSSSPAADAEIIDMMAGALASLGVNQVRLRLNSIGCPVCRPDYHAALLDYLGKVEGSLCHTCKERMKTNPLRVLDCKEPGCAAAVADAPRMLDYLCEECDTHFAGVRAQLKVLGIDYEIDTNIVRGLDYYTKTVFEFVTDTIGAQGTVCGGGRYDGLSEEMGGPPLPAMGFGMGIERLKLVMEAAGAPFPEPRGCDLYLAAIGEQAGLRAAALCQALRREGFWAEMDLQGRSVKAQMRAADRMGAHHSMVIGDGELAEGKAGVKNMRTGQTTELPLNEGFVDAFYECLINEGRQQALQSGDFIWPSTT